MSVRIQDRNNHEDTFSHEDGRTFTEDGHLKDVDPDQAIQPGDVITIDGGKRDLRVIEVSADGLLAQPQTGGSANLSETPEIVPWSNVELWGDRSEAARYEHYVASLGPIERKSR